MTEQTLQQAETIAVKSNSLWRQTLRRLFRQRSSQIGMFLLGSLIFIAIFAPFIAPYGPREILIGVEDVKKRSDPCIHILGCPEDQPQHIMGTDGNVRDVFSRIIYGSRISLMIGFTTITISIVVGTSIGAVSGYFGGIFDLVMMRVMDVILAFPSLLLAIAIVSLKENPTLWDAMLAIAIVQIPHYARIMRSSVLLLKTEQYVEASRSLGASHFHIIVKRIIPNSLTPLIVQATLGIASAILDAAALSFFGIGAQPPTPEWGAMLSAERNQLFSAPHLVIFPGVAIMITVLAFNLLGDGLRDSIDPRLAHSDLGAGE